MLLRTPRTRNQEPSGDSRAFRSGSRRGTARLEPSGGGSDSLLPAGAVAAVPRDTTPEANLTPAISDVCFLLYETPLCAGDARLPVLCPNVARTGGRPAAVVTAATVPAAANVTRHLWYVTSDNPHNDSPQKNDFLTCHLKPHQLDGTVRYWSGGRSFLRNSL